MASAASSAVRAGADVVVGEANVAFASESSTSLKMCNEFMRLVCEGSAAAVVGPVRTIEKICARALTTMAVTTLTPPSVWTARAASGLPSKLAFSYLT